jgi:hypothetical protein
MPMIGPDILVILCTGFSERISEDRVMDLAISMLVMKQINRPGMVGKVLDGK